MTLNKYLTTYLIMISYGRSEKVVGLIQNFNNTSKPEHFSKFIIIENSPIQILNKIIDFTAETKIHYEYINNSNKASLINYCIQNLISEEEALIILLDNDITFNKDFILNYYRAAIQKGCNYYFGGALQVEVPDYIEESLKPYLSISATGKPDKAFIKQIKPMFLGCNYCVFKSQWLRVNGLDERFSAGSKYGLGADESVFQKKLKFVGFEPFFVMNNEVKHLIDYELYDKKNVLERFKNNGYTHGFQNIIIDSGFLKISYFRRLLYLFKRLLILILSAKWLDAQFKYYYFSGFLKAAILYIKIDNKNSYLGGLIKDSVKID